MAYTNSERLMPREVTKRKTVSKLPDFPCSKFGRQMLATYLFRIYPLQDKPPAKGRSELVFEEQIQDLTEFLMQNFMDKKQKAKIIGIPMIKENLPQPGIWTAIFKVDGLKIWEGRPCLFVTWYDFDLARMLCLHGSMDKLREVLEITREMKPDIVFQDFQKYMDGYQTFAKTLQVNSLRLEQENPKGRWISRTFVRPRYKHLTFDLYQNELNLSAKHGAFPTDPRDLKAHVAKFAANNPMGVNLTSEDIDKICEQTMKLTNPGYSGYGGFGSATSAHPPQPPTKSSPYPATDSYTTSSAEAHGSKAAEKCDGCGTASPQGKKCSACKSVVYCNRDCQRKAWPRHKHVCKK